MSHLTRVIVRTLEPVKGGKKPQPIWRIGLSLNSSDKSWPARGRDMTDEQCWTLASLVDASKPYSRFRSARAALSKLGAKYAQEMGVETTTFSGNIVRYTRDESFDAIRSRGLAWAARQAALDPDNESRAAA